MTNHGPLRDVIARPWKDADESGEPLVNHAAEVCARILLLGKFTNTDEADALSPATVARCVALLHDFGKTAPAFQMYVRDQYPTGEPRRYTYHALLGAFAAVHALERMGASERVQLAAWAAILRHHGSLPDITKRTVNAINSEWSDDRTDGWAAEQRRQISADDRCRSVADELLTTASRGAASWESFSAAFEDGSLFGSLGEQVSDPPLYATPKPDRLPEGVYERTLRLWSALTLADKTAAGSVPMAKLRGEALSLDDLERHVESKQQTSHADPEAAIARAEKGGIDPTDEDSLNALREAARRRVRANAPRVAESDVGLLTLPTGLGKTFAGITGAFELADALANERGLCERPTIVYALPYTSIIEQTRELFEDEDIFGADPRSLAFTVHHYLSETVSYTDSELDTADGSAAVDADHSTAELVAESWRSGVVLTTFVQLFESLAGPTNSAGLKLPALVDAVVILDEPQALPKSWWNAIRRLCRLLVDEYDARLVSMTATQPTLFTEGAFETTPLLAGSGDGAADAETFERRAYESTARVRYRIDPSVGACSANHDASPVPHEDAASRLVDAAVQSDNWGRCSVLAVCNTVASSRTLTERVETEFERRDVDTAHIGETYRTVLDELDEPGRDLPDPETVAAGTLVELGFEQSDDGEWRPPEVDEIGYVATFNSRFRPLDRRALITIADVLATAGVSFLFISTQAIEAGVDISFTRAYRDIAPLDSVVQTAGRCNRSFEWGPEAGEVTVWTLAGIPDHDDESPTELTPPAKYVYSESNHLRTVADILLGIRGEFDGDLVPGVRLEQGGVDRYFQNVEDGEFFNGDLVDYIDDCDAEELAPKSLIDDSYRTVDVLVAVTEGDHRRLEELADAFGRFDGEGYEQLAELADLRVSVPVADSESFLAHHVRADRRERTDPEGSDVLVHYRDTSGGTYELDGGGFVAEVDDGVSGRFTTF